MLPRGVHGVTCSVAQPALHASTQVDTRKCSTVLWLLPTLNTSALAAPNQVLQLRAPVSLESLEVMQVHDGGVDVAAAVAPNKRGRYGGLAERAPDHEAIDFMQEVALHSSAEAYGAYLAARDRVREAVQAAQHAKEMHAFEERLRKELNDQVAPVRNLIIERVLTRHCPRCQAAFVDFDGCLALTCAKASCKCAFCAICLEDCGADAHAHVGRCQYAGGSLHAAAGQVKALENRWRIDRIRQVGAAAVTLKQPRRCADYCLSATPDRLARVSVVLRLVRMCHVPFMYVCMCFVLTVHPQQCRGFWFGVHP